jgi:hypothetical protein
MNDRIFLIQDDQIVDMRATPYESEPVLQKLLADYPALLPGDATTDNDQPWLLVKREAAIPDDSGAERLTVDHLFLDRGGVPTLVEVKRASDTRIRREVVGQMLDYAANAVTYWTVERIQDMLGQTTERRAGDMEQVVADFLGVETDPEDFWQLVKTNLQAGRIRMIFVADRIPPELRRIVEFLNNQLDPAEVLAVEMVQYEGGAQKTLVPRVVGQTMAAKERKTGSMNQGRRWNEADFMAALASNQSENDVTVAQAILAWAQGQGLRIWWGTGKKLGSFIPVLDTQGIGHYPIAVWTNGSVEVQFQHMRYRPPFDSEALRRELLERLNHLPDVNIPSNALTRRPSFRLSVLHDEAAFQEFLEILDWYYTTARGG